MTRSRETAKWGGEGSTGNDEVPRRQVQKAEKLRTQLFEGPMLSGVCFGAGGHERLNSLKTEGRTEKCPKALGR